MKSADGASVSSGRGPVVLACALVVFSLLETASCFQVRASVSPWFPVILINPSVLTSLSLLKGKDLVVFHCSPTSPTIC